MTDISTTDFGSGASRFTLRNDHGLEVVLTNYGATIVAVRVPDAQGRMADVVLGYDDAAGYVAGRSFFGCTVGRFGNRIAGGSFVLDGLRYQLAQNNGANHLHGGLRGFHQYLWDAEPCENGVLFSRLSADGEEGYPGNLQVQVRMTLNAANELRLDYQATTDAPTHVNLTNHSFFNLAGHDAGSVLDHELCLESQAILPVNEQLIPEGHALSVEDGPFDFRSMHRVGERISVDDVQLQRGAGYDHCFIVDGRQGVLRLAGMLREPRTRRFMEVLTTEPGMQLYTGNFLDGSERGKGGAVYGHRSALCLETQHHPDSPNQPHLSCTELRPGQLYASSTIYRFGVS